MAVAEAALVNAGLQAGLVDAATVSRLRPLARVQRCTLLEALGRELRLPASAFWQALARLRGLAWAELARWRVAEEQQRRLPGVLLQKHAMMPMCDPQGTVWLVLTDPDDRLGPQAAARLIGQDLPLALADPDAMASLLQRETGRAPPGLARQADEDATGLFDRLMKEALLRRATDVHLEADEAGHGVRLRVDGVLQDWGLPLPRSLGEALVSRVKVLAGMDISESRAPQDGALKYTASGWDDQAVDLRVASMPTLHGERLTLRLLGAGSGTALSLGALGMPPQVLAPLRGILARPHGILLVTGPTGSGKSTTLYAALRELDCRRLNILTVEDPVEQQIAGISQVGVGVKVGFAEALRAFLRHDPDIILVGEVRDIDTADTALKAAATGHLVLSTLHTNSAVGAVTRLVNLGCERYLIADTVAGVLAQRLVRRLCSRCAEAAVPNPELCSALGLPADTTAWPAGVAPRQALGCPHCLGSGYRGRIGLYEALWLDTVLADALAAGATQRELQRLARQGGRLYALADDARAKLAAGQSTLAELRPHLARHDGTGPDDGAAAVTTTTITTTPTV